MELHEFYQKYANTPIEKRFNLLSSMKEEQSTNKIRVFCPSCGELKLKKKNRHFEIVHPELDKIIAKMLDNGFTTKYT